MENMSKGQLGLFPERAHQRRATLHRTKPPPGIVLQLVEAPGAEVAQLAGLEMAEEIFRRVQLRRIGRQELDLDLALAGVEVAAHEAALMDLEVVPDDEELIADLAPQRLEEVDALLGPDRSRVEATKTYINKATWIHSMA